MVTGKLSWPSALVAIALIFLVAGITIGAIVHYQKVEDALKIWNSLGVFVGILAGAIVTIFFTRQSTDEANKLATLATRESETFKKAFGYTLQAWKDGTYPTAKAYLDGQSEQEVKLALNKVELKQP